MFNEYLYSKKYISIDVKCLDVELEDMCNKESSSLTNKPGRCSISDLHRNLGLLTFIENVCYDVGSSTRV